MGRVAEDLGVEIFPGFAASKVSGVYNYQHAFSLDPEACGMPIGVRNSVPTSLTKDAMLYVHKSSSQQG